MSKIYVKLFAWLAQKLLDKLAPNVKTFLLGATSMGLGLFESLSDGAFYKFCCENLHIFCNLTSTQFYAGMITTLGFANQLLNGTRTYKAMEEVTPDPSDAISK